MCIYIDTCIHIYTYTLADSLSPGPGGGTAVAEMTVLVGLHACGGTLVWAERET